MSDKDYSTPRIVSKTLDAYADGINNLKYVKNRIR